MKMAFKGIDCATKLNAESLRDLKANGVTHVGRYLPTSAWKGLTKDEVKAISDAGLYIFSIYEDNPTKTSYFTYNQGVIDAKKAMQFAEELDQPKNTAIYFTVDYGGGNNDLEEVGNYFKGIKDTLQGYEVGGYGSYTVVKYLKDKGLIKYVFQTYAWSNGKVYDGYHIYQYSNGQKIAGIQLDLDEIAGGDVGAWKLGSDVKQAKPENKPSDKPDKKSNDKKYETYKIQKGDTFWDLEEKHKWEHGILQKLNPKVDPAKLQVGQEIYIPEKLSPQPKKSEPKKHTEPITHYIIKAGDTFWDLENRFGLPHGTLQRINPHVNPNKLHPGQTINVFIQEKKITTKKENHYTIRAGDTFWDLEEKHGWPHGILQKLNPKVDPNRLHVGQKIIIP
jgi:LysM repeat protein